MRATSSGKADASPPPRAGGTVIDGYSRAAVAVNQRSAGASPAVAGRTRGGAAVLGATGLPVFLGRVLAAEARQCGEDVTDGPLRRCS